VPGIQSILDEFKAADTQVLGVSVDSIYSHENWANSLGGVSFPLLADFHPKGATAEKYGVLLSDKGITDRATVIIDKQGVVRYAVSVTPAGQRDPKDLLAECQKVNKG
jgi:alkyl hydroperoxide reductase subunit AhpC